MAFFGSHQAGIATAAQDCLYFAAFDVARTVDELRGLLEGWTAVAARLTAGERYRPAAQEAGAASDRHRRGGRPRALEVDPDIRVRPRLFSISQDSAMPSQRSYGHSRHFVARALTLQAPVATYAYKHVQMTRRSPSTQYTSSPGSHQTQRRFAGPSKALDAPRAPAARRARHATSWASRMAPTISAPRTPP